MRAISIYVHLNQIMHFMRTNVENTAGLLCFVHPKPISLFPHADEIAIVDGKNEIRLGAYAHLLKPSIVLAMRRH